MDITDVVQFSAGIGSWAAAKRVVERRGTTEGMVLLFADTLVEDADAYRFLDEAAANIGAPLVRIADGRTPWEVFRTERMIGNSRLDPCSKYLKRRMLDAWRNANCDPERTTFYVGLDWTEGHRFNGHRNKPEEGLRARMAAAGWRYEAPMMDRPLVSKEQMLASCVAEGIEPPLLYKQGFPHNNCGGACVKAGHAQWAHLLRVRPETFAEQEAAELATMAAIGTGWTVLTDRRGGPKKPLTLREFRRRIETGEYTPRELEGFEWGGCGCAIDSGATL